MLALGLVFLHVARNSANWAYMHTLDKRAEYLAESSVQRAIWMMQASQSGENSINTVLCNGSGAGGQVRSYQSATWSLPGGNCSFTATGPYKNMPYTIAVTGTGVATNGNRSVPAKAFAVLRMYNPNDYASGSPQAYIDYVIFSNHNGQIKDNVKIYGHPELGGKGVYVNGKLDVKGKPIVYGDIRVTGKGHNWKNVGPWPPGQYNRLTKVAREPLPTVDLAYYKSIADEVYKGDFRVDDRHPNGTNWSHPRIIYVDGKVKIKGNFTGYGIIVASKGVEFDGNMMYGSQNSGWAIISGDKVKIKHDATIYGGIYAHSTKKNKGKIEIEGTAHIFGYLVADEVKIRKKAVIEYDPGQKQMKYLPGSMLPTDNPVTDVICWGIL